MKKVDGSKTYMEGKTKRTGWCIPYARVRKGEELRETGAIY